MIDVATVDQALAQQGQFCLLDWMLQRNLLSYGNYENWRYGRVEYLLEPEDVDPKVVLQWVEQTRKSCGDLKLASDNQEYFRWDGDHRQPLLISQDRQIHQAIGQRWLPPQDIPQMDLFMDNSATIAENELLSYLGDRRFSEAQNALQTLAHLNSSHPKLGGYQDLINYGLFSLENPHIEFDGFNAELMGLDTEVTALAKELLGSRQRDYLAFAWRRVAEHLLHYPMPFAEFKQDPRLHVSYPLQQIPDWQGMYDNLANDKCVMQSPILLSRMAEAALHCQKSAEFYWYWGLLFERFPENGEILLKKSSRFLIAAWDEFLNFNEDWPAEWFLGYLLIRQPGLIHHLGELPHFERLLIQSPVNYAVFNLIQTRLNERDEKNARQALKDLSPIMLSCYLNKRDWYKRTP